MKREHFSTDEEPALQSHQTTFHSDPSEVEAGELARQAEIDTIRDSIANEPHIAGKKDHATFQEWVAERRARCSTLGTVGVTLIAGLVAGPFAIVGAIAAGRPGLARVLYIILFGPIVEELLKQSGMIYLLERRPYRVQWAWQFLLAAILAAVLFAGIENMLYINNYASVGADPGQMEAFSAFRWKVCTSLHVCCSIIASLGLIRVWKHQVRTGAPADLSVGFPLFITAIAVHGIYNFMALFLSDIF